MNHRGFGVSFLYWVDFTKTKKLNFIIHEIGWQVLVNQNKKVSCALSQHRHEKTFVLDNFIPSPSKHVRSWMLVKLLNLIEERQTNENKLCMSSGVHSLYCFFSNQFESINLMLRIPLLITNSYLVQWSESQLQVPLHRM